MRGGAGIIYSADNISFRVAMLIKMDQMMELGINNEFVRKKYNT